VWMRLTECPRLLQGSRCQRSAKSAPRRHRATVQQHLVCVDLANHFGVETTVVPDVASPSHQLPRGNAYPLSIAGVSARERTGNHPASETPIRITPLSRGGHSADHGSDILDDAQRVINRRMGIACTHRVANPKQHETPIWVAHDLLRASCNQRIMIHCAHISALGFQRKIQLVQRHSAIVHHHLIVLRLLHEVGIIRPDPRPASEKHDAPVHGAGSRSRQATNPPCSDVSAAPNGSAGSSPHSHVHATHRSSAAPMARPRPYRPECC